MAAQSVVRFQLFSSSLLSTIARFFRILLPVPWRNTQPKLLPAPPAPEKPYQDVMSRIKGTEVTFPDFRPLYTHLAPVLNPNYPSAKEYADVFLGQIFASEPKRMKKLRAADFGMLTSYQFPEAPLEELKTMTRWFIWIFTQDDECDEVAGERANDFDAAQKYRKLSCEYLSYCCGLSTSENLVEPSTKIMASFKEIGNHLKDAQSAEQRKLFYDEFKEFQDWCQVEQEYRLSGKVPTVKEYWELRTGTIGGGIAFTLLEFQHRMNKPRYIANDPKIKRMWGEANTILFLTNDMFSVTKEIASGEGGVLNIVPAVFCETSNLQLAIDKSYQFLVDAIERFEVCAADFVADEENVVGFTKEEKEILVRAFRASWAGHFLWCTFTPRYKVGSFQPGIGGSPLVL